MRTALVVMACLAVAVPARAGSPAVTIDEKDVTRAFRALVERLEEPVGMVASADVPKLGLLKGDVVRAVNGRPPNMMMWEMLGATTLYLDVMRDKKRVLVQVSIKLGPQELMFDRERLKEAIAKLRDDSREVRQLTKKGAASGVVATMELFGYSPFMQDATIRTVNGKPIATVEDLTAALTAAVDQPSIRLGVERIDQAFTVTMQLEEPVAAPPSDRQVMVEQVKKLTDTSYEVPAALRDQLVTNPMAFSKGARVGPAMKDGKVVGYKIYAVRPSSIYAAVGLSNGDTIEKINGTVIDSAAAGLEAFKQLRDAKRVTIDIVRRGKPITLSYAIK